MVFYLLNIEGLTEHIYYHLGQIVSITKLIRKRNQIEIYDQSQFLGKILQVF